MFTLAQIEMAHSKVKSGADFPAYIQNLKKLGVTYYETFVEDGHTDYYGTDEYKTSTFAKYVALPISGISNKDQFLTDLKKHQQGKTNYLTFCNNCATSGIEKWAVSINKMTCTYYNRAKIEILVEQIP